MARLIFPGGPDVDPRFFGEQPVWALGRTNYKRDAFEIGLIKAAHAAGKPLFGICRGCQVINVAFGGTVWQDLPSQCPEVIEGIEGTEGAAVVAVQWHPENMWPEHEEMKRLFADFLSRVKESA